MKSIVVFLLAPGPLPEVNLGFFSHKSCIKRSLVTQPAVPLAFGSSLPTERYRRIHNLCDLLDSMASNQGNLKSDSKKRQTSFCPFCVLQGVTSHFSLFERKAIFYCSFPHSSRGGSLLCFFIAFSFGVKLNCQKLHWNTGLGCILLKTYIVPRTWIVPFFKWRGLFFLSSKHMS